MRMNSGKTVVNPFGFTIVEVMIVLVVTLVIFASAVLAISGRSQTAEFTQAVNSQEINFQAIMNNVATGYFNTANTYCNVDTDTKMLDISNTVATDNGDCTVLGEALMLTTGNDYYGLVVFGAREDIAGTGSLSTTYFEAQPTIADIPNLVTDTPLSSELQASWIHYTPSRGTQQTTNMVAFLDDPAAVGTTPATGSTSSGAVGVNVIPVDNNNASLGSDPTGSPNTVASTVLQKAIPEVNYSSGLSLSSLKENAGNDKNPPGGVTICFVSRSTPQSVLYTFGGNNQKATIQDQIYSGASC
jgi:type II secretory pathway pseudopilin PulG